MCVYVRYAVGHSQSALLVVWCSDSDSQSALRSEAAWHGYKFSTMNVAYLYVETANPLVGRFTLRECLLKGKFMETVSSIS